MTASRHDSKPAHGTPAPDLTRFRLPSSKPTQKWLETTRALLEGFTSSAAEAEQKAAGLEAKIADQVAALKTEAVRLRNSARVIQQLLDQVGVESPKLLQAPPPQACHERPEARRRVVAASHTLHRLRHDRQATRGQWAVSHV